MKIKRLIRSCLRDTRNCIIKVFNLFPISDIILFESNPDFNDEGYWMCKKFLAEGMDQKYSIYWYLKDHNSKIPNGWNISCIYVKPQSLRQWITKYYVLHTAKCILDSCMFIPKRKKEQFRLFLHHGMPIKRIDKYIESMGDYDYVSIGSSFFSEYYERVGVPKEKQVAVGYSRNDQLRLAQNWINRIFQISNSNKVIMWMPTYRQHESSDTGCNVPIDTSNETGLPIIKTFEDALIVNQRLSENRELLVIKPHQSQDVQYLKIEELTNIKIISTKMLQENGIQLYSLLAEMDALITDYSSVYIDFLLTGKPIGLTIDDITIYEKEVGFAVNDYKKDIQGFYINDIKDFFEFLDRINIDPEFMKNIMHTAYLRFHDETEFTSSERLFRFIKDKANL